MRHLKFVKTPDPLYIETEQDADYWVDRYINLNSIGFDTETNGLHKINTRVKFFSFSDGDSRICAPVRLLPMFGEILENPDIEKCMTNAKFDMHMVQNHGIQLRGRTPDSMIQDWLKDENRKGRHGLKATCKDYLGLRMAPFKEVFGSVGSIDKEVRTLVRMHDALEALDEELASDLLVLVGKADGDEKVLKSIQKLTLSKQGGYTLKARQVLAQARMHDLVATTGGTKGYVSDFLNLVGGITLDNKERAAYAHLLEDSKLIEEAHEVTLQALRHHIGWDLEPLDMLRLLVADYASLDAWGSFMLVRFLREELDQVTMQGMESLLDYYEDSGVPFTRTLWNMERRGFKMDVDKITAYRKPMAKDIGKYERTVVSLVGFDINLRSPQQLREAFYSKDSNGDWIDRFGNAPVKWTKGGASGVKNPSTDKEAIAVWAAKGDKLAETVQNHRKFSKLHDTYLVGVPQWVDHRNRIHTDLKQHGTVTARLSSGDPNLQNIPSKGEWGDRLRDVFIAGEWGDCSPDWCVEELRSVSVPDLAADTPMRLVVADYEQLEMRIMAHFSEDATMIDAILQGLDLHCRTAELAGGLNYDELVSAKKAKDPTPAEKKLIDVRSGFKAVGFGLIYGIGAVKLGRQLGLKVIEQKSRRSGRVFERCPEAQGLIQDYFGVFPGVMQYIDETKQFCHDNLFVQSLAGRYRRLPDIASNEGGIRAQAERQSVNSIIQGSAADITIKAMLKCEFDKILRSLGVRMLLQIHDELVFEVPDIPEYYEPAMERIKELMENPYSMRVPINISMNTGYTWGEAK